MIHVFFIFLLAADLLHPVLDKLPILIFGSLGWLSLLVQRRGNVSFAELLFILFCISMLVTTFLVGFSGDTALYMLLFLLQIGIFSYIYGNQKKDYFFLSKCFEHFINWNVFIGIVGIFDFLLFQAGYVSYIRDYFYSYKVDSFYANPNMFGIMAAFSIVFLIKDINYRALKMSVAFKVGLLTISLLISTSSMALGLPILYFLIRKLSPLRAWLAVLFFILIIIVIELTMGVSNIPYQVLLNKRLELWLSAFQMWLDAPFFGIGTGNFQLLNQVVFDGRAIGQDFGLHSLYLWLIIETGIVGFALFLIFIFYLVVKVKYLGVSRSALPVLVVVLVSQITEFYLEHEEIFIMFFWLVAVSLVLPSKLYQTNKGRACYQ